jgi:hypothetical protein
MILALHSPELGLCIKGLCIISKSRYSDSAITVPFVFHFRHHIRKAMSHRFFGFLLAFSFVALSTGNPQGALFPHDPWLEYRKTSQSVGILQQVLAFPRFTTSSLLTSNLYTAWTRTQCQRSLSILSLRNRRPEIRQVSKIPLHSYCRELQP